MYLDKNKNPSILNKVKEEGWYIKIEDWLVLEKQKDAITFPERMIYWIWEMGNVIVLKADKDNVQKKLEKINEKRWREIGYRVRSDKLIKYWLYQNKNKTVKDYEFIKVWNTLSLKDVSVLSVALTQISKDLEVPDKLVDLKDDINQAVKPSDFVSEYLAKKYEEGYIILSNELGIIIDLRSKENNISAWNVFDSIYYYVNKNVSKLNKVIDKFGIISIEEEDIYYVYTINDNSRIEFRNDGVFIIKNSSDAEVEQLLIDKPLKLEWYFVSNFDIFANAYTNIEYKYYKFQWDIVFPYFENTDKFNKRMWAKGIRMMATGKHLQLLYSALDKWIEDEDVKEFEIIDTNWIDLEKKIFAHWWNILFNENDEDYIVFAEPYATKLWENISLEKAKQILDGYLKKPYQHILFLWFLWAFLKKDLFKMGIYTPLIQVIWFTESWKTELVHTIMKLFWYSINPIKEGNTTIQPRMITLEWSWVFAVQKKLWDYTPVFFDEFTGNVKQEIEELFRSVYNEKDTEKWRADQTVVKYKMVSPIVIWWEKAPSYLSVLNRSIYLQLDKLYQADKATYLKIKRQLEWKIVLEDMWNRVKDVDLSKYKYLADKWEARTENNYNWLRIVNSIYWELYTQEELDEMIKSAMSLQQKIISWHDELKKFFVRLLVQWKRENNISVFIEKEDLIVDIYISDEDWQQKNHAILKLKELLWDESQDMSWIKINFSKLLREKKEETRWIVNDLIRHLRNYRDATRREFLNTNIFHNEYI